MEKDIPEVVNGADKLLDDIFLPESLVRLVLKIAQKFEISSYGEFIMLDTFQSGLATAMMKLNDDEELDERQMTLLIVNIVRLSEKSNNVKSPLTNVKLDEIFRDLGISSDEYNNKEFEVFKSINFKFAKPVAVEAIYYIIESQLSSYNKDLLFEFSLDLLRVVYLTKQKIYDMFTKDSSSEETLELQRDETLLGAAVLVTMMKILRFPDRTQNKVFDRIVSELGEDSFNQHLNQLAAIIFNFVKPESGVVQHSKEGVVKAVNKGALQTDRNC